MLQVLCLITESSNLEDFAIGATDFPGEAEKVCRQFCLSLEPFQCPLNKLLEGRSFDCENGWKRL